MLEECISENVRLITLFLHENHAFFRLINVAVLRALQHFQHPDFAVNVAGAAQRLSNMLEAEVLI